MTCPDIYHSRYNCPDGFSHFVDDLIKPHRDNIKYIRANTALYSGAVIIIAEIEIKKILQELGWVEVYGR